MISFCLLEIICLILRLFSLEARNEIKIFKVAKALRRKKF